MNKTRAQRDQEAQRDQLARNKAEHLHAMAKMGYDLWLAGRYDAALAYQRRIVYMMPDSPEMAANLAGTLWSMNRLEEALALSTKSYARWPNHYLVGENHSKILVTVGREEEGGAILDKLIAAGHATHDRHVMHRGLLRMLQGRYPEGFEDYEIRYKLRPEMYGKMLCPMWAGEDLNGKRLFVQSEQGSGDTILFSRFMAEVKRRYPEVKILFCTNPALTKLLWRFHDAGICDFIPEGIPWDSVKADYGIYLASLPKLLGVTVDRIPPDPGYIEERVAASPFNLPIPNVPGFKPMKIGVAWTGNPEMAENAKRSVTPQWFMDALGGDPRYMLYSLQIGKALEPLHEISGETIIADLADDIGDLVSTAAMIAQLDLVVTICTSIAHISCAMGVPTWILLHSEPYWIWGRHAPRSGWWPNATLFRQRKPGDWNQVMADVRRSLDEGIDWMFVDPTLT